MSRSLGGNGMDAVYARKGCGKNKTWEARLSVNLNCDNAVKNPSVWWPK